MGVPGLLQNPTASTEEFISSGSSLPKGLIQQSSHLLRYQSSSNTFEFPVTPKETP